MGGVEREWRRCGKMQNSNFYTPGNNKTNNILLSAKFDIPFWKSTSIKVTIHLDNVRNESEAIMLEAKFLKKLDQITEQLLNPNEKYRRK